VGKNTNGWEKKLKANAIPTIFYPFQNEEISTVQRNAHIVCIDFNCNF